MKKKSGSGKRTLTIVLVVIMGLTVVMGLGGLSRMPVSAPAPSVETEGSSTPNAASSSNTAVSAIHEVPCASFLNPPPQQYRIYPHLAIIVNSKNVTIPAGIGLTADCERIIHTNDASGTIDVEPYDNTPFTLGDFFAVWGERFSKDWIMDYYRDADHELTMTVDGKPSTEYENLVLKDKQEIIIEYKKL